VGVSPGIAYSGGRLAQPVDGIVVFSESLLAIVVMRSLLAVVNHKGHEGSRRENRNHFRLWFSFV
jgi:hypothetical protein